ncbi:MAG: mandelate racemase/muconate lactonizing enzyme family protein [Lautropia sp.]|nr:mandelate racemase/muconate lactonizing enzyme family protein [Lautropia sp.]
MIAPNQSLNLPPLTLRSIEPLVYRVPLRTPVQTSFGIMHDRPALLLRVCSDDGVEGWGEVWCNFPAVGAEHRARLVQSVLAPLAVAHPWRNPQAMFEALTRQTAVLAIQSGEPGPIAQSIAGLDMAMWDLLARREGLALWRLLGGASDRIRVYASGLNPDQPDQLAAQRQAEGHTAFKLKVGFGTDRDLDNLGRLRSRLGDGAVLMADANQAWSREQAVDFVPQLAPFGLGWLEEPLRADTPWYEWQSLQAVSDIPLAAGENVAGSEAFDAAISAGALTVVQPDMAKWGGFSGCLPVARRILKAGLRFCPHYLGGGVGLLASGHLLAAAGGDGMLEIDANPNPLRNLLWGPLATVHNGHSALGSAPGLGPTPDLGAIEGYRIRF